MSFAHILVPVIQTRVFPVIYEATLEPDYFTIKPN